VRNTPSQISITTKHSICIPAWNISQRLISFRAQNYLSLKGDKMTIITFERSGGVVANEIYLDLDLDSLPEDSAKHLLKLVEKADFFNIPRNLGMTSSPDEFQYKITVDDGDNYHSVRTTDTTMPRSLLSLVRELTMVQILSRKVTAR
jgi:hypothetical protein